MLLEILAGQQSASVALKLGSDSFEARKSSIATVLSVAAPVIVGGAVIFCLLAAGATAQDLRLQFDLPRNKPLRLCSTPLLEEGVLSFAVADVADRSRGG